LSVNVATLKETHPHERRVALVPSGRPKADRVRHQAAIQTGAGEAIKLADALNA
jgi:NAD(P) transhydrogenase subunit alpha